MKIERGPLLHFDFATPKGKIQPITFSNPIEVITTTSIDDVISSLERVQQRVHEGKYAAGYISYEAAPAFHQQFKVNGKPNMPLIWFGIFEGPTQLGQPLKATNTFTTHAWEPSVAASDYYKHMDTIQSYLKNQQTEQVNYTIRMKSQFSGDPIAFYKQLQKGQDAQYTAYVEMGGFSIVSASPELFFQLSDRKITTKPMAGTVVRGKTFEEDEAHAKWLQQSEKNRHENEQIVQLMKQDLKGIAKPGTLKVPKRYEIEKYPTIYQMTSTVTAELLPHKNVVDIFKTLFPSGSITGLPKAETMEIIAQLEQEPRDVYSGAIGYITPEWDAIFNVPIRTVTIDHRDEKAIYGAGSGITLNSAKSEEYNEVLAKAKVLETKRPHFELLETIGLFHGELYLLDEHLRRLQRSATYFDYPFNREVIKRKLYSFAKKHSQNNYRVRLLLHKEGTCTVEGYPIQLHDSTERKKVVLAKSPIQKENVFLYHKTTYRDMYEEHKQTETKLFDVLLWNEDGEVTEFTTGNIVVEMDQQRFTPPVQSGLLAGTFREVLLREGKIKERTIRIEDLKKCASIWFINSVRKWVRVKLDTDSGNR